MNESRINSHNFQYDERNNNILININGSLFKREDAKISVFDAGFILGDGAWEGIKLYKNRLLFIDKHLKRLFEAIHTLQIKTDKSKDDIKKMIIDTLAANNMTDDVHIRLMVTRGEKITPYQDPNLSNGKATIVIIAEYKRPNPKLYDQGLSLYSVSIRRTSPDSQDQKLNSHSKINCILACYQASIAGYDEALMLDRNGAVATCNSTHFFMVKDNVVYTSDGLYCLGGITRSNVIEICKENNIPIKECNFSLHDVYNADEAFTTGTYAGLVGVNLVDNRKIGEGVAMGEMTKKLSELYQQKCLAEKII